MSDDDGSGPCVDLRYVRVGSQDIGGWADFLDHTEIARSLRFRCEGDRDRFIVARGLLRLMLGHAADVPPRRIRLGTNSHGKPFPLHGEGLACNVAHSGDYVMAAVGQAQTIGVDLERHRFDLDLPALARRMFTHAEQRSIFGASGPGRTIRFFRHWVFKEALLKAIGSGLSLDPRRFEILCDAGGVGLARIAGMTNAADWHLREVTIAEGYSAAVVVCPHARRNTETDEDALLDRANHLGGVLTPDQTGKMSFGTTTPARTGDLLIHNQAL